MLSITLLVIVCLANIILASVVLISNTQSAINRVFASLCFALPLWSIIVFLEDYVHSATAINLLVKADFFVAALMVMLFYEFCRVLTGYRYRVITYALSVLFAVSAILTIFGKTVTVEIVNSNVIFDHGFGFLIFVVFFTLGLGFGLITLVRRHVNLKGKLRAQILLIFFGLGLSILCLILADIVAPYVGYNSPSVTRLGIYGLLIFTTFSTYAIVRHRFLDIRKLVARSVTYVLLLITMASGYAAALFGTSQLFFSDSQSNPLQLVVTTILAITLAFTFQPLRHFFERVTDRYFYRDHYDSQIVLNNFSGILVSELNLDRILKRTITDICQELHIEFGQIVVFDHDRVYRIEHHGPLPKRLMIAPELRRLNHPLMVADELPDGERKELLDEHGIRVSLMLRTREQFVGYFLLGDKLSGDIYSKQDIEVLEIISKQLAVAILNAKAYVEIHEFNQTLQARIDHATGRLRVANRHLRELDRVKDEFISMASHQLRTPLTTTKGYLSMLMEGDAGKLTKMQREFAGFAYDGSERMVQLISDLLDVSRLSAGRFIIQAKPTDMTAVMQDEVRRLQHHADVKGIGLSLVVPKEVLPLVMIDETKTRQVIMNFIDNAIYYTKAGQVGVALSITAGMIHLEVHDTGIGVPETAKKHLFTKFFRADNAQEVRPDGTGLGLFLAKKVIEEQGGTIVFSSIEGKGSTFGFDLPLVQAPKTVMKVSKSLV